MSTYNHFTAKPSYLFGSPLVPQPSLILRLVFIIDHGYQLQFDYLLGLCPLRWWIENVEARRVQPTGSDPSMVNRTYVDGRVQVSDPQFFLVHWLCNITKIHVGLLDDLIMSRPVFFFYMPSLPTGLVALLSKNQLTIHGPLQSSSIGSTWAALRRGGQESSIHKYICGIH